MTIPMRVHTRSVLSLLAIGALLCLATGNAHAQGKSGHAKAHVPPGHAKKKHVVTTDEAIVATREVLGKHGYVVVRVVNQKDGARVVYYRRGNMGRGKGRGPVEKMIIRPAPDRIVFELTPKALLVDINVKLGF
jgi:hypothetical protein